MNLQTAKEEVEASMPNLKVIDSNRDDNLAKDSHSASNLSAAALISKFLGDDVASDNLAETSDGANDTADDDVQVVLAKKRSNTDSSANEPLGTRAFIVSEKGILGSRG